MEKITYVCITQNRLENLKRNFPVILPHVDRAVIIDGGSVDGTEEYCKSLPKVEWHYRKWDDSFANQYNEYLKYIDEGWVLLCDDDELPSSDLLKSLRKIVADSEQGNRFCCVEFRSWAINPDDEVPKDHPDDYWRKLFFRYHPKMRYTVDLHQCLVGYQNNNQARSDFIYYHLKTTRDVARNACRNYFIAGIWLPNASDGLRGPEWDELRAVVKSCYPEIETFSELDTLFIQGNLHEDLKAWMIKYKDFGSSLYHELHHFFEYYCELRHPEECTDAVKERVEQMSSEKKFFDISLKGGTWSPPNDSRELGVALTELSYQYGDSWRHLTVLSPDMELKGFNGVEGGNSGTNFSWSGKEAVVRLYGIEEPPAQVVVKFAWPPRSGQRVVVRVGDREEELVSPHNVVTV